MTARIPTTALAGVAAVMALAGGAAALWTGISGASADLTSTTGGRGLTWLAGMALMVQVVAAAAIVTGRRLRRDLLHP